MAVVRRRGGAVLRYRQSRPSSSPQPLVVVPRRASRRPTCAHLSTGLTRTKSALHSAHPLYVPPPPPPLAAEPLAAAEELELGWRVPTQKRKPAAAASTALREELKQKQKQKQKQKAKSKQLREEGSSRRDLSSRRLDRQQVVDLPARPVASKVVGIAAAVAGDMVKLPVVGVTKAQLPKESKKSARRERTPPAEPKLKGAVAEEAPSRGAREAAAGMAAAAVRPGKVSEKQQAVGGGSDGATSSSAAAARAITKAAAATVAAVEVVEAASPRDIPQRVAAVEVVEAASPSDTPQKEATSHRDTLQTAAAAVGRPTLKDASAVPREMCEMSNEVLMLLAAHGYHGAREERLIREVMFVEQVSFSSSRRRRCRCCCCTLAALSHRFSRNLARVKHHVVEQIDWEVAKGLVAEIDVTNKAGMTLANLPYQLGTGAAVIGGVLSIPMVFDLNTALWFNELAVRIPDQPHSIPPRPLLHARSPTPPPRPRCRWPQRNGSMTLCGVAL